MSDPTPEPDAAFAVRWWSGRTLGCFGAIVLIGAAGVMFTMTLRKARESVRAVTCEANLNQLQMGFLNYHDTYGSFPPAYVVNERGERMHSWRVLLLPYLDKAEVYEKYNFDEPWDSPENQKLASGMHYLYHCPSGPHKEGAPLTDYVVVTGAGTAFPGDKSTSAEDFRDGTGNTIMLVEIANSDIHWMEPRDLEFEQMSFVVDDPDKPSISSPHPCGPGVVFADSITGYRLDQSLRPEILKALLTISGGEGFMKDELVDGNHHSYCRRVLAEPTAKPD